MKKTLLSVLAGLTVMGSASALPTPEDRKALCQLLIDKGTHVWVEKAQACIPVNPCESDQPSVKDTYCVQVFKEIQVRSITQAKKLSEKYIKTTTKELSECGTLKDNGNIPGSQDYIKCVTDSGMYFAFEFDDFTELKRGTADKDIAEAALIAYGHPNSDITETECQEIADFASKISSFGGTRTPTVYYANYGKTSSQKCWLSFE